MGDLFWYYVRMGGWMERRNLTKTVTPKWVLSSLKLVCIPSIGIISIKSVSLKLILSTFDEKF